MTGRGDDAGSIVLDPRMKLSLFRLRGTAMGTMFHKSWMIAAVFTLTVLLRVGTMVTTEGHAAETTQPKSGGIVSSQSETGPGQIAQRAATDKTVVVSDADDGKKVAVPVGGRLVVRLSSNLTTGFQWRVVTNNPLHLKPEGEPTYESPDTQLMGVGGTQVFRFSAVEAEKTRLELEYIRPWEAKAAKRFTVTVQTTR
jgi:inhibitor of cysteine peptidase